MPYKYFLLISILIVSSLSCAQKIENNSALFLSELVKVVQENHLAPKPLDDQMSKVVFNSFLNKLDPEKKLFVSSEIEDLRSYETSLDEAFKIGNINFFNKTIRYYKPAIDRAKKYFNEIISKEIELSGSDIFQTDFKKIGFSKNDRELKEYWNSIITKRNIEYLYVVESAKPSLSPNEQKEIAIQKTKAFFEDYFYQISRESDSELLDTYANCYISYNDYQSQFMSPEKKANWDARMVQRSMVGVGLSLESTLSYPQITKVFFEGPSWKTKKIIEGDVLTKVSNTKNEMIDVAGFPIPKVIDFLKGEENTSVKLEVKHSNEQTEVVEVIRGKVHLTKAMSFILEEKQSNKKVGYLYLPRFYYGENSSADDVLAELNKLKKSNVDGIIFDLRNNKGGSAGESIEIMGYFLNGGPVMQSKYTDGSINVREDDDQTVQYEGRVIILVNDRSSSASELVSGTLQDYERAIIVGGQTFGKGTSQNFFDVVDKKDYTIAGEVKLSVASFYTGKGRSTQFNGVTPDIILPDEKLYVKTGERKVRNALQFENLNPNMISKNHQKLLNKLKNLSNERQATNSFFIKNENKAIDEKNKEEDSLMSLNYKAYKSKMNKINQLENAESKPENYIVIDITKEAWEKEKNAGFKKKLESDHYVKESLLIMNDYLSVEKIAELEKG